MSYVTNSKYVSIKNWQLLNRLKLLTSSQALFTVKAGIVVGAVYYVNEQGLWRESTETTKLYEKLCAATSPYIKQAKSHLPIEVPDLPSSGRISYITKQSWNSGVSATFNLLANLPDHIDGWTTKGVNSAMNNPELKKFIDSFSSVPEEPQKKVM